MKNWSFFLIVFFLLHQGISLSQDIQSAGGYLDFISKQHKEIAKKVLSYTSAVAHGKSARKVENSRQMVLQSIKDAAQQVSALPPFEGDKSIRDSTIGYLKTSFIVMNNEYEKILDMEAIADQTYDGMETYLLAQELAEEHVNKAEERLNLITLEFAAKHKITLIENDKDETRAKLKIASQVNVYHRMVYLVFFKSNKQEFNLINALERKDVGSIEKNKTLLLDYVSEGLKKLDTMKAYANDKSLKEATKQTLEFYKKEGSQEVASLHHFLEKEEEMVKAKQAFDAKKDNEKTKDVVSEYNKAIHEFNSLVSAYNSTTNSLNQERTKAVTKWEKASLTFLDKHVP